MSATIRDSTCIVMQRLHFVSTHWYRPPHLPHFRLPATSSAELWTTSSIYLLSTASRLVKTKQYEQIFPGQLPEYLQG